MHISIFLKSAAIVAVLFFCSCSPRQGYVTITGFAQGGNYAVKYNADGVEVRPETVRDSVEAILHRIDNSLSGYNRNSILSRFNAGETVVPDEIFLDIYGEAYGLWRETGGLVDAASAPLFDLWGFGFRSGDMPSDDLVARTVAASGMGRLREDMNQIVSEDGSLAPACLLLESASDGAAPN